MRTAMQEVRDAVLTLFKVFFGSDCATQFKHQLTDCPEIELLGKEPGTLILLVARQNSPWKQGKKGKSRWRANTWALEIVWTVNRDQIDLGDYISRSTVMSLSIRCRRRDGGLIFIGRDEMTQNLAVQFQPHQGNVDAGKITRRVPIIGGDLALGTALIPPWKHGPLDDALRQFWTKRGLFRASYLRDQLIHSFLFDHLVSRGAENAFRYLWLLGGSDFAVQFPILRDMGRSVEAKIERKIPVRPGMPAAAGLSSALALTPAPAPTSASIAPMDVVESPLEVDVASLLPEELPNSGHVHLSSKNLAQSGSMAGSSQVIERGHRPSPLDEIMIVLMDYLKERRERWRVAERPKLSARAPRLARTYRSQVGSLMADIQWLSQDQIPSLMSKIADRSMSVEDAISMRGSLDTLIDDLCRFEAVLGFVQEGSDREFPIGSKDASIGFQKAPKQTLRLPPRQRGADASSESSGGEEYDDIDDLASLANFIVPDDEAEEADDITASATVRESQEHLLSKLKSVITRYSTAQDLLDEVKRFCLKMAKRERSTSAAPALLYLKWNHDILAAGWHSTSLLRSWERFYEEFIATFVAQNAGMSPARDPRAELPVTNACSYISLAWNWRVCRLTNHHRLTLSKQEKPPLFQNFWKTSCRNTRLKESDSCGGGYTVMVTYKPQSIAEHLHSKCMTIVCPKTVVPNWQNEIEKWIPYDHRLDVGFRIFILDDAKKSDRIQRVNDWCRLGGVLLTSYDCLKWTLRMLKEAESHIFDNMSLLVLDEAHILRNRDTQASMMFRDNLKTPSRIALTGTPLQNNLREYFNMSDLIAPGYLGNREYFESTFLHPIMKGQHADSTRSEKRKAEYCLTMLSETLDEFVLRKDSTILEGKLPPLHEYVLFVDVTPFQKKIIRNLFQHMETSTENWLMTCGSRITQTFNHPFIFYSRVQQLRRSSQSAAAVNSLRMVNQLQSSSNELNGLSRLVAPQLPQPNDSANDTDCVEADMDDEDTQLVLEEAEGDPDGHRFDWVDPLFPTENHIRLQDVKESSKMWVLFAIVEECRKRKEKVIIFSHLVMSLDYVEKEMISRNIKFCRLDGSKDSRSRQDSITQFNANPDMSVFLISTKAGGTGVNLVSASRVIILDYGWNPTAEEQAIGRAFRLGQERPVFVYRLVVYDTFEDAVFKNQIKKSALARQALDKKSLRKLFTKDELKDYFNGKRVEKRMTEELNRRPLADGEGKEDEVLRNVFQEVPYILQVEEMRSFFPALNRTEMGEPLRNRARKAAKQMRDEIRTGRRSFVHVDMPEDLILDTEERTMTTFSDITLPLPPRQVPSSHQSLSRSIEPLPIANNTPAEKKDPARRWAIGGIFKGGTSPGRPSSAAPKVHSQMDILPVGDPSHSPLALRTEASQFSGFDTLGRPVAALEATSASAVYAISFTASHGGPLDPAPNNIGRPNAFLEEPAESSSRRHEDPSSESSCVIVISDEDGDGGDDEPIAMRDVPRPINTLRSSLMNSPRIGEPGERKRSDSTLEVRTASDGKRRRL